MQIVQKVCIHHEARSFYTDINPLQGRCLCCVKVKTIIFVPPSILRGLEISIGSPSVIYKKKIATASESSLDYHPVCFPRNKKLISNLSIGRKYGYRMMHYIICASCLMTFKTLSTKQLLAKHRCRLRVKAYRKPIICFRSMIITSIKCSHTTLHFNLETFAFLVF